MIDLPTLKENIRQAEGFRPYVYSDSLGVPTIGYGFNISRSGPGLPKGVAESWLTGLAVKANADLSSKYSWYPNMSSARCNAVAELFYQLGDARFSSFDKMITALSRSDYKTASAELLNSVYNRQVPQRAARLAAAIANG
jgi:lysozyme